MEGICAEGSFVNLGFDVEPEDFNSVKQRSSLKSNREKDFEVPIRKSRSDTYLWENIEISLKKNQDYCLNQVPPVQKTILSNVTGCVQPGEFLAIMGASGAGKTTLLNCLTFRDTGKLKIRGGRYLNGQEVNMDLFSRISGYVQQKDLFFPTFTVKEHLQFHALLRMDKNLSCEERMNRVDKVIEELGLSKCVNTVIGYPERDLKSLSGGERKRLAFASEVLTDPSLLFCDEPTSGLDSYMAQNVIEVLKNFAISGKTVVCTIHQPSSEVFALFDKILLMAEGRTAFLGPASDALLFFSTLGFSCPPNYNPADFFIHTLAMLPGQETEPSKTRIKMICDSYDASESSRQILEIVKANRFPNLSVLTNEGNHENKLLGINESSSLYQASWMVQFRTVFWRSVISVIRESAILRVKSFETIFITVIVAIIFQGQTIELNNVRNIQGALFLCVSNTTYQHVFGVISVITNELPIFLREHRNGMYRTDVYFMSKTLADLPIYIFFPFFFVSVTYYVIGLNPTPDRFLITCGIIILVTHAATSFGCMISYLTGSAQIAVDLTNSLLVLILHMGGYFLRSGSVPIFLKWMRYFSWYMYGFEALSINQWAGASFNDTACSGGVCTGEQILHNLDFNPDFFYHDIVGLIGLIIGFRLLGYFALLARTYRTN